ncbi:MAG: hypothetical protein ACPG85_00260 [Flavobacteriales bacterium]
MKDTDWDALETRYREHPESFGQWMEEADLSPDVRATWEARMAADGVAKDGPTSSAFPFTFPLFVGSLIALPFWMQYWRDGGFDPTWAFPWFGLLATLPLMGWHTWHADSGNRRRQAWGLAAAVAVTLIVVAFHHVFKDWPSTFQLNRAETDANAALLEQAKLGLQAHDLMLFHAPLLLLGLTGAVWCRRTGESRVTFNVLQVGLYTALIVGVGGLFTGLTVVMAEMLELDTVPIAVHLMSWGGASALAFAHHVWLRQPDALNKVLPLIAGLFIPLFVLLESGFLLTYLAKGLDALSRDREELLVFNLLLGAVIGLVLLHSALKDSETRLGRTLVAALVVLGIVADGVAILAIGSRLMEWGWTPNRLAVLATNLLCLGTLLALVPAFAPRLRMRGWPEVQGVLNRALVFFFGWTVVVALAFPGYQAFQNRAFDPVALGISTADPQSQLEADLEAVEQEVAAKEAELEEAKREASESEALD